MTRVVLVIAHAGHWAVGLAYFSPVLILGGLLVAGRIKDRGDRSGRG